MAKEMMIIFVYDTQMVQKEEDDPFSAILYFHPSWVSDQQKTALCGQLMGAAHCIKSILSTPKVISLQSGKFSIKEYGRYFMAVGTDRNIADWLLEHRANTMASIISFFHQDIEAMAKIYDNTERLSTNLYLLFETYLKYLFMGGNIFSYTPVIKLPKSASNVFLEAIQILQCCQEINYVLGGTVLYHNKVVATQLSSDLTKTIVLTDPYRIKCPAEMPCVNFEIPIGVQLLQIYISGKEYFQLNNDAVRSRTVFQFVANKSIRKTQSKCGKELVMSAMKRDQSIIFTSVPEEDSDPQIVEKTERHDGKPVELQNRPKFLNLKSKITDINQIESKSNKTIPFTPNYGQISVCSTPMTDLNKMIHTKPMSICTNTTNELTNIKNTDGQMNDFKPVVDLKLKKNLYDCKKYSSAFDIREKLKSIESSITMKYYKIDLTDGTNDEDSNKDCLNPIRKCKTITDPYYPIFRSDGTVVSRSLYESSLKLEMEQISNELYEQEHQKTCKNFDNFDYCAVDLVKNTIGQSRTKSDDNDTTKIKRNSNKDRRKSLSLPLKSLSVDGSSEESTKPLRRHSSGMQLTPLMSKLSSFEDRSSGFGSCDATPSDYRLFTPTQTNFPFQFKKKTKSNDQIDDSLKKCVLFVCGQQDMVVTLLLQEDCCTSVDAITKLWEICTENLGKLEKQLHHCLETYPSGSLQTDSEPYSYLHLDQEWDTLERGGPWGNTELGILTHFHRDFKNDPSLTEILVRCADGVIYGHRCGTSEVFYHQPASNSNGIPTPGDPMGNVPLKAKRRLERDHSIILL